MVCCSGMLSSGAFRRGRIFGGGTGIALLLGALSLFLGLLLGLLRLVLELGVQRLALFHGELVLLHQIVDDLLALLKALLPQLNAGGQCPNARENTRRRPSPKSKSAMIPPLVTCGSKITLTRRITRQGWRDFRYEMETTP